MIDLRMEEAPFAGGEEVTAGFDPIEHTSYPEHWHNYTEIIRAARNGCRLRVNSITYELEEGDFLLIWPTELHEIVRTPERATRLLQFDISLLETFTDFAFWYEQIRTYHLITGEQGELYRKLERHFEASMQATASADPFRQIRLKLEVGGILLALSERAVADRSWERKEGASGTAQMIAQGESFLLIQQACSFIRKNCNRPLTLEDAANSVGLSRFYFSRLFHAFTSSSFTAYLRRERVKKALTFLIAGESATDAAYRSGFGSISSFNHAFTEVMGCSPREYKKMYRSGSRGYPFYDADL